MVNRDWNEAEHPRDDSNGKFVARTSALMMLPQAEAWAYDQWVNSEHYGTLDRHFRARDRLVEERMRQLVEPAEFRAWFSEKTRQENAKMRRRLEFEERERQRRMHRTYRTKFPGTTSLDYQDETIRTVNRGGRPVRVRVQSRELADQPYRAVKPTRMQPGRRGVFFQ